MPAATLAVRRDDLRRTELIDRAPVPPGGLEPRVVLRVERFALTANTITYGARADVMSSFDFFPLGDPALGCIPAWGYATVLSSDVDGVAAGDRYFGYVPMSTHFTAQPTVTSPTAFRDAAAHRPPRIAWYNTYNRSTADPLHTPEREPALAVFRPLFMTSFVLADYLEDNQFFGAERVVFSSASSKTAYGTAFVLSQQKSVELVGLTGEQNRAFVEKLGLYGRVLSYGEVDALPLGRTVYVDIASVPSVRSSMRGRLGENLLHDCSVGGTHWDKRDTGPPDPRTQPFLAAAQLAKRIAEWGPAGFQGKVAQALKSFLDRATEGTEPWARIVTASGGEAVSRIFDSVVNGHAAPDEAYVLTL